MKLEQLLDQPTALPSMPRAVQELIACLGQDDVRLDAIATHLESDPVLAAKTLRLANSAYFLAPRPVTTVGDALQMLGLAMVRNLVLGSSFTRAFAQVKGLDLNRFWQHCGGTAAAARWLALNSGKANPEEAYMLGLMHGLGHLVLHAGAPEAMQALNARIDWLDPERSSAETESLGYHHGTVGAALARRWRFPEALSGAIEALQQVAQNGDMNLLPSVRLASWVSREALGANPADGNPGAVLEPSLVSLSASLGGVPGAPVVTLLSPLGDREMPALSAQMAELRLLLPQ